MTAIPSLTFAEFEAASRAQGFDEVLQRDWASNLVIDTHTHPFAVSALMVSGDLWLTCDGQTRHLREGDRFELPREAPHAERYGPAGATFWAARRHAA
jgi:quercetin dioxygenase-like cupin family protein